MTLPGETIATGAARTCPNCGITPKLKVCWSAAGHYIGTWCNCGPYSRESYDYYPTYETAEIALREDTWIPRF